MSYKASWMKDNLIAGEKNLRLYILKGALTDDIFYIVYLFCIVKIYEEVLIYMMEQLSMKALGQLKQSQVWPNKKCSRQWWRHEKWKSRS